MRGESWQSGSDDIELSVRYEFFHDEARGFSASVCPRVILPTAAHTSGENAWFLLSLWLGKDFAGGTSVFGGRGYLINPGPGNRNVWQAAVAVTHELSKRVLVGPGLKQQGSNIVAGTAQTRVGLGSIIQPSVSASLLVSGGPTTKPATTSMQQSGSFLRSPVVGTRTQGRSCQYSIAWLPLQPLELRIASKREGFESC